MKDYQRFGVIFAIILILALCVVHNVLPRQTISNAQIQENPPENLNTKTDNLNILFLGVSRKDLLMASVYSINYKNSKGKVRSGAVFFPPFSLFSCNGKIMTLEEIYQEMDTAEAITKISKILENALRIKIAYSVKIDKAIFREVEKIFDPITVNGEEIELANLFEMEASPRDKVILKQLMNQLTNPTIYFYHLPRLLINARHYVTTDFPVTPENLWLHFKIVRRVDTSNIIKVIAPGEPCTRKGERAQVIPESFLRNIIYKITT